MTPEDWKKLDALFHEALELEGEARAAHLEKTCGDNHRLRAEAERLLAAHEREGSFIDSPIFSGALEAETRGTEPRSSSSTFFDSPTGRRVGPYQILGQLGRGGMGEVFLAEDTRLNRKVALKLLPAAFNRIPDRTRRFKREAKTASALNHPNILTIHEIGETEGAPYIVSEFVEGETLRERMRRGPLSLETTLDVARQVASALAAAHAAGIVHRDIKPENVMTRPDGLVKVLDFGLAKLTGSQDVEARTPAPDNPQSTIRILHSTTPGLVMGTAHYMSPEQARGLKVDHRTDIFSLGVMLYEMLAGRRPFEGDTPSDVIAAILMKEPPPLEKPRVDAGPELAQIVMKCLAKEREERFQTVSEFAAQLQALTEQSKPLPPGSADQRLRPTRLVYMAAAVVLLLLAAVTYWKWRPSSAPDPVIRSLVVLPLENLSGDPAQEYLADGMTDALIGDLAKIGALRVISRTSAMRYKGAKKPLSEIARELNVDAVVEGAVQRSGDRVGIRARLIIAGAERQLWAESYERDFRDALGLQTEIARAIAREIQTSITPAERSRLAAKPAVNRKALDDYLKGQYHRNRQTEEQLQTAIEYFQSAVRADPSYAPAYAGLAECYGMLGSGMVGALSPQEARRQAEEAAGKALVFDQELVEAHIALGYVKMYNWDWAAAEREFKLAIDLNPNNAAAHTYFARYLSALGRADEALAEMDRAQELDPLSLGVRVQRGFVLEMAHRYGEAIDGLSRVIAEEPKHYQAHFILGRVYAAQRRFAEAIAAFEKAASLSDRASGALGFLGMTYGLAGRKEDANNILRELLVPNRRGYVSPVAVANVYTGLGAKDQAFAWLEKAFQERSYYLAYLKVSPASDPLRSDPRFDDLLRRTGLLP